MGLREKINQNSRLASIIVAGLGVLAIGMIVNQFLGSGNSNSAEPRKAFFTIDDGATYFADEASKINFTHEGKPAYRAYVYKAESEEPFVAYIERINPVFQKQLPPGQKFDHETLQSNPDALQVKQPGSQSSWVLFSSEIGHSVSTNITSPTGSTQVTQVEP